MSIQSISDLVSAANSINTFKARTDHTVEFSDVFGEALAQANSTEANDQLSNISFLAGDAESIHDVTIAAQKAEIALQLTVTIRDRLVEAYNEIMRMQV